MTRRRVCEIRPRGLRSSPRLLGLPKDLPKPCQCDRIPSTAADGLSVLRTTHDNPRSGRDRTYAIVLVAHAAFAEHRSHFPKTSMPTSSDQVVRADGPSRAGRRAVCERCLRALRTDPNQFIARPQARGLPARRAARPAALAQGQVPGTRPAELRRDARSPWPGLDDHRDRHAELKHRSVHRLLITCAEGQFASSCCQVQG